MMKIYNWNSLTETERQIIMSRPTFSVSANMRDATQQIIEAVKVGGDKCVVSFTEKYDHVQLRNLQVTTEEIDDAFTKINSSAKNAIEFAKKQLEITHKAQLPQTQVIMNCEGVYCEKQSRPIERVGLYVPGGSAPLVSTVLMLALPAQIANCPLRILCTPPNQNGEIDPHILYAAKLCSIQSIYKIGGAQAIAAMAYGTETIPRVDKIFGPGNAWVTQAKMLVSQDSNGASIDLPAGPSEIMIIADANANLTYVVSDLLSQAEHGADSQVMVVTSSEKMAAYIAGQINQQLASLSRRDIVNQVLANSRIIIVSDVEQAITVSNRYAPEHLILQIDYPKKYIPLIQHAGAVFLGPWTAETLGDYVTGSNHVLPTYGYARSYSGLSVLDFMKFISFQTVTKEGLKKIGPYAEKLAEIEGLDAHKQAVSLRLREMVSIDE